MFNKLITYVLKGAIYNSLEIYEINGSICYSLVQLKKRKKEFYISYKEDFFDLSKLKNSLDKNIPLFLTVNTSEVLTKKTSNSHNTENIDALVNLAFPNLKLQNFYFEATQIKNAPIITISKKEYIENILKELKEVKIEVYKFSLGISSIHSILPYLNETTLKISNAQVTLNNGIIENIGILTNKENRNYHINGLDINNTHILGVSHIIDSLTSTSKTSNYKDLTNSLTSTFSNNRLFYNTIKIALFFIIFTLLINFFIFNYYYNKVNELNEIVSSNSSQKDKILELNTSVKQKKERVETINNSSNSKTTFYIDRLSKNVPNTLLLNTLTYQPLSKPVRIAKPILLSKNILLVGGTSRDSKDFSDWVEDIEQLEWVYKVETLDYDHISTKTSEFLIKINIDATK